MAIKIGNKYIEESAAGIIEVGNDAEFKPKIKFKKWGGESEFSLDLQVDELGTEAVEDGKIKWKGTKKEFHCWPVSPSDDLPEGGYEFEIILKNKHVPYSYDFTIADSNCAYHIQPPMNERIGMDGIAWGTETEGYNSLDQLIHKQREENVNSIAIYNPSRPMNTVGGPLYRAGKIGTIRRAKAIDKDGNWVWCPMFFVNPTTLRITVPEDFANDDSKFPIRIDPTFGYTTIGGSSVYFNTPGSICLIGSGLVHTAGSRQRVISYHMYGRGTSCAGAGYVITAGVPVARLGPTAAIALTGSDIWNTSSAVSQVMMNGIIYGPAIGACVAAYVYYDVGSGNQRSHCPTDLPNPWVEDGQTAAMYSYYATYESYQECVL